MKKEPDGITAAQIHNTVWYLRRRVALIFCWSLLNLGEQVLIEEMPVFSNLTCWICDFVAYSGSMVSFYTVLWLFTKDMCTGYFYFRSLCESTYQAHIRKSQETSLLLSTAENSQVDSGADIKASLEK